MNKTKPSMNRWYIHHIFRFTIYKLYIFFFEKAEITSDLPVSKPKDVVMITINVDILVLQSNDIHKVILQKKLWVLMG